MTLLGLSLPRMNGDAASEQVAEVADALYKRADELATDLASAITKEVRLYQTTAPVPFEMVLNGCASNIRPVLEAITADTEFDTSAAATLGIERARDGDASVEQLMDDGRRVLAREQLMPGVPEMLDEVQVEATFRDGRKLVTLHRPVP